MKIIEEVHSTTSIIAKKIKKSEIKKIIEKNY